MRIAHWAGIATLYSVATLFGPPQITVRAVTTATAGPAFELDVKYHTEHDAVTVSGRAEGVRAGKRVSLPLTVSRQRDDLYTVSRQWDAGTPWVLVFAVEQGKNGAHGFAEGIVSLDATGSVKRIEYIRPTYGAGDRVVSRATRAQIDASLKALGVSVAP